MHMWLDYGYAMKSRNEMGDAFTEELPEGFDFVISPNPTFEVLNILFQEEISSNIEIEVFDMLGRRIVVDAIDQEGRRLTLNLQSVTSGVYNLILSKAGQEYGVVRFVLVN